MPFEQLQHIRILNLEDSPIDSELITRELKRAGIEFSLTRVDSESAFIASLERSDPDVILADYNLPGFDGASALKIARKLVPDVPFVFVSGSIGEERAVQALREGAVDYIIKDRLSRLPAAIVRALNERRERQLRHHAQEALRATSRQNEMILNHAAEAIIGLGRDGRVIFANPAAERITGWTVAEIFSAPSLHGLLHPMYRDGDRYPVEACPIQVCSIEGQPRSGEETFFRKTGEAFPVRFSCTPMYENSEIAGLVVTFEDVSERRVLKERLDQANRVNSLGRIAATIAHEFNNVLMGIQPYAELIRRQSDEKTAKAAEQILGSVSRGKRITSEILRFTQPAPPLLQPLSLSTWLQQVTPDLQSLGGANVEVRLDLNGDPLQIRGDAAQLQQVVTNLVLNARDAMQANGSIGIALRQVGREAEITVRDTGSGMTADVLQKIFEPLFTTKRTGTGLGLAVARQIIDRHGGSIHAESTPGHGTAFRIRLPLLASPDAETAGEIASSDPKSQRVLIVEDDPAVASGVALLLESDGIEVRVVHRGADAIAEIERFDPNAVVIDLTLPDMDGTAVYDAITEKHSDLPVLFSSGRDDEASLQRYLATERAAFLHKPYDIDDFKSALGAITEKRHS